MLTKQMDDVLEFLRAFIAGGSQQDFKLWAGALYQKLYHCTCQPLAQQTAAPFGMKTVAVDAACPIHGEPNIESKDTVEPEGAEIKRLRALMNGVSLYLMEWCHDDAIKQFMAALEERPAVEPKVTPTGFVVSHDCQNVLSINGKIRQCIHPAGHIGNCTYGYAENRGAERG